MENTIFASKCNKTHAKKFKELPNSCKYTSRDAEHDNDYFQRCTSDNSSTTTEKHLWCQRATQKYDTAGTCTNMHEHARHARHASPRNKRRSKQRRRLICKRACGDDVQMAGWHFPQVLGNDDFHNAVTMATVMGPIKITPNGSITAKHVVDTH